MKILHLAIQAPYNEGWGYQENLLPKFQAKIGHNVTLITSCRKNMGGGTEEIVPEIDYQSPDGFRVIRKKEIKIFSRRLSNIIAYHSVYKKIREIRPDVIMIHALGNIVAMQVRRYVRKDNPECVVIADNHLDDNIGAGVLGKSLGAILYRVIARLVMMGTKDLYAKVYGVTPWRCEFANKIYGVPWDLLDVFPAGADDDKINFRESSKIRSQIREKHNIGENDFLLVTGGKIDEKKNIDRLMEAVAKADIAGVKLLVFGGCSDSIRDKIENLSKHPAIRYIGWINSDVTYDYFLASDLVFFPGQHSVMWEQACACGIPCVMKDYHGMHHCDFGGNCRFLTDDSVEGIMEELRNICETEGVYASMRNAAQSGGGRQFLYSELAKKSLEAKEGKQE